MNQKSSPSKQQTGSVAISIVLCLALLLPGCTRHAPARAVAPRPARSPTAAKTRPPGSPIRPRGLTFLCFGPNPNQTMHKRKGAMLRGSGFRPEA